MRVDSGDLTALSKEVNRVLEDVDIFISSGVDEFKIQDFLTEGGVAAGFGPGTALVTSTDAPKVDKISIGTRRLTDPDPYEVQIGSNLQSQMEALRQQLERRLS